MYDGRDQNSCVPHRRGMRSTGFVSASKDALQTVIQFLRDQDYGQPLQFTNYR